MQIVKRDGRLEKFNSKKIKISIENAANDCETILNESDLKILVSDIEKTLNNIRKDSLLTSSYEVIGVIFEVLKRDGFNEVLNHYIEFDK